MERAIRTIIATSFSNCLLRNDSIRLHIERNHSKRVLPDLFWQEYKKQDDPFLPDRLQLTKNQIRIFTNLLLIGLTSGQTNPDEFCSNGDFKFYLASTNTNRFFQNEKTPKLKGMETSVCYMIGKDKSNLIIFPSLFENLDSTTDNARRSYRSFLSTIEPTILTHIEKEIDSSGIYYNPRLSPSSERHTGFHWYSQKL